MPVRDPAVVEFDAITIEGGILPAEWLERVAHLEAPAQSEQDYGVPKGLNLRDEIARYWRVAGALWNEFAKARAKTGHSPAAATERFIKDTLVQVFCLPNVVAGGERELDGRIFPITLEALGGRVPIVVGTHDEDLDRAVLRHAAGGRRRSAWGALQEYLNASPNALWGIASNGLQLRLGRDNASLTRPAWLEADLERIFVEDRFADFSVLWLILHGSRFGRADQALEDCPLERWRSAAREQGSRARKDLRDGVQKALESLGAGFLAHPANTALREALTAGALGEQEYFNELLRLVYRMIFLLTVEERGILHPSDVEAAAREAYATGYGMRRLRERAVRRSAHDRHGDLWQSVLPVFRALGRSSGEARLGLPGLGGLFSEDQCPHLDAAQLANSALLMAIFHLAWVRRDGVLTRVNWKDMGPEELGSVYESLLELVPRIGEGARTFSFAGGPETGGHARKLTGSYYTPDELVQQLLDTALEPVIERTLAENPGEEEAALLRLSVVDPACGSGHFLLAAARRLAEHLARIRSEGTPGAEEYRHTLRDVVTHCIYGVDRNPMALELARMALWLEAHTPDRALGFVDHHLVCGDALLGLIDLDVLHGGIPDEAFKALSGDDREVVRLLGKINRSARKAMQERAESDQGSLALGEDGLAQAFASLDELTDEAIESVEAKRAKYKELRAKAEGSRLAVAADVFLGAFFIPKYRDSGEQGLTELAAQRRFPTSATVEAILNGTVGADHGAVKAARAAARVARVMHWPLAFPNIVAQGGFDVVIGNPPWERIKLQEQEYFAARAPEIAQARNKAERDRAIQRLARADAGTRERRLFDDFQQAKRLAEAASAFCHTDARYSLTGRGDVNTYALFAETAYRTVNEQGRAGLVLPTGIATDDSTKLFFGDLAESGRLVSLFDFENREGLFPDVDSRQKFCLLTIGRSESAEFAFFATRVSHLDDSRRRFRLAPADFALINPNTRTCPIFRSEFDAELTKKIYSRVPVLIDETKPEAEGNPWGVSFMTMFHMSNDSHLFLDKPGKDTLPLYEAKMIHQFDHRYGSYESRGEERGYRVLPTTTAEQYEDPEYRVQPFYWVRRAEVEKRLDERWSRQWLLASKNVTAVTNERTVVATVIPLLAVGHSLHLILFGGHVHARQVAVFLACLNSLVLDYIARQKVGGLNLSYFLMKQFPIPSPASLSRTDIDFISSRVLRLTYTASDLAGWAYDLGMRGRPIRWRKEERDVTRAELDAYIARLYGLSHMDLRYVLDPSDVEGHDYPSETFRVLKQSELDSYGEFRTRRLVLEAWDRLFGD